MMEITLNLQDPLERITILTIELSHPLAWYRSLHSLNSSFILLVYCNYPRSFTYFYLLLHYEGQSFLLVISNFLILTSTSTIVTCYVFYY